MSEDPIARGGLAPRFWERKALTDLNEKEWEALCDGCGKCCMNKLEDEDTGEVAMTRVACRLFDDSTCRCAQYSIRHQFVPECIVMKPSNIDQHAYWMPQTCAYKRLYEGKALPSWHPLLTGTAESVHAAGVSMRHDTVPEFEISDEDWEDHIIEEPMGDA
ncbi:YcgN family cysteine cluster protein [Pacificoceanicola onchidii]|uniref:YcgN family cysteine cluster protein n=1 Tax=Pacificoceanicola onchidii TaxID=2562685 RepID=UPI0010A35AE7|nr:YcgN family cysteine cluster protein [Pacificoceanicola onchidii]